MGQFGLDSSDIISGFDEILKTQSLDFFFLYPYLSKVSRLEEFCIFLYVHLK